MIYLFLSFLCLPKEPEHRISHLRLASVFQLGKGKQESGVPLKRSRLDGGWDWDPQELPKGSQPFWGPVKCPASGLEQESLPHLLALMPEW